MVPSTQEFLFPFKNPFSSPILPLCLSDSCKLETMSIGITLFLVVSFVLAHGETIPTTLEGPFKPVTVPLDDSFRGRAVDLPENDPRVQRTVVGFEPEQISVSLSSTYDSVWISWITGMFLSSV